MKLLVLCAFIAGAFGHPLVVENLITKHVVNEDLLRTPMTEVSYETLLPVVRETVRDLLHSTIPESCTPVIIPYMSMGMMRLYALHTLRDVSRVVENTVCSVLEDSFERTTGVNSVHIEISKVRELMKNIRHEILMTQHVPEITITTTHFTPTQLRLVTMFNTIMKVYVHEFRHLTKTFNMPEELMPFEKLLMTVISGPIDVQTYWDTLTVEEWLTVVTKEMSTIYTTKFNMEICETTPIKITTIVNEMETFMTRLSKLSVKHIMTLIPRGIFVKESTVTTVLNKVMPLIKDFTFVEHLVQILKIDRYQTPFMHFTVNLTSELLVTQTIECMNVMTTMTDLFRTKPEILSPVVEEFMKITGTKLDGEILVKLLSKMSVLMRTKGVQMLDIVDVLLKTFDTRAPTLTSTYHVPSSLVDSSEWSRESGEWSRESRGSWETRSWESSVETDESVAELFKKIVKKVGKMI